MLRVATTLTLLTTLISGAAGAGPSAVRSAAGTGTGTNILVVGIDSRAGLSKAEKNRLHVGGKGCNCTDVMMLVHLSEDSRRASVVSVPRDSYVEYADGSGVRGKINGAYARGGRALTVKTVEKVTGLRVDHYLETGFTGFEQAVDGLGGATLCTDRQLTDENSGLDLSPGMHHADGNGTLRYVRARHIERPGDLGRVRRQQRAVSDLLTRLTAEGALADPEAAARTAATLLKSVRTDERTSVTDLARIGLTLARLRPAQTEFVTVPIQEFDHRVPGVGSTLIWHEARSRALWKALAEDRPVTGDRRVQPAPANPVPNNPAGIKVRVDHAGTAAALGAAGFVVTDTSATAPAARPDGPALIRYAPGREADAATLAAALPAARRQVVPGHDTTLDVAVGTRQAAVKRVGYDRNVAEGAPMTGDRLGCLAGRTLHAPQGGPGAG
ncbi:LCP family protein [Streptomyces antimicrobicus]|uniref:LCP family protein n=1 Tax=Streptomyces antimicrobicus TaxID=2883108 RepID=A0ABS8B3N2_9ACTN|nr:LCP family protein [Streptomyces antimicrobicus]MCB5179230.1 LCP family protein [Streptomyces antimicrobicus]